jgi:phosphatidylserine decarboxylase
MMKERPLGWIAPEGMMFLLPLAALSVLGIVLGWSLWMVVPLGVFTVFTASFFRNPSRRIPEDPQAVVSPADGVVVRIQEEGEVQKIAIFMNVFNVHVNRMPVDGQILDVQHIPGGFLNAARDDAPLKNERTTLTIQTLGGTVVFSQIAGLVARRIVCYAQKGDQVRKGQRFGLIRFGSRVDVTLPRDWQRCVNLQERVVAGTTVLAKKTEQ